MSNNSGGTTERDKNSMKSAINDGKLADMKNDATETKREMITQRNVFKKKEFQVRPSLLRKEFEEAEGCGNIFFNFAMGVFVMVIMSNVAHDFFYFNNPFHHFWLIHWNFQLLWLTMAIWTLMLLSTIVFIFYGQKYWSLIPAKEVTALNQALFLCLYGGYIILFFYASIWTIYAFELPCACSFIITIEGTRLAMKSHGFVRENIDRCIKRKLELYQLKHKLEDIKISEFPALKQFLYFSFCPSFIYKDEYPRNPTRSWALIFTYLGKCLASIYFVNICFTNFIIPFYSELDYSNISIKQLIYSIFPSACSGSVCLFVGIFYGLLHSWNSMFAELMFFGDRNFYSNWWSSKNMAQYYRNWNLVVHEWLHAYIYLDIYKLIGGRFGSLVAQILVFFLSSVFHEYWFAVSLRMFYPAIFILYFVFGGIFYLITQTIKSPRIWNSIMWWNLLFGTGLFVSCYSTEWYARHHMRCPRIFENELIDLFVPRIWTCIKFNTK